MTSYRGILKKRYTKWSGWKVLKEARQEARQNKTYLNNEYVKTLHHTLDVLVENFYMVMYLQYYQELLSISDSKTFSTFLDLLSESKTGE